MNLVNEQCNDNKFAHAHTKPESKKTGFVAPIIASAELEISNIINMLTKHGTTNVIIR